jgi:hypothetical protein
MKIELDPIRLVLLSALATLASLCACADHSSSVDHSSSGANLLKNGGFESDSTYHWRYLTSGDSAYVLPGWILLDGGVEHLRPAVGGGSVPISNAPEGNYILDLAPYTTKGGGIRQTFATSKGVEYVLRFRAGTFRTQGRKDTSVVEVWIDNMPRVTMEVANPDQPTILWQTLTVRFRASGDSTTLDLRNNQNPLEHFAFVDDAIVTVSD